MSLVLPWSQSPQMPISYASYAKMRTPRMSFRHLGRETRIEQGTRRLLTRVLRTSEVLGAEASPSNDKIGDFSFYFYGLLGPGDPITRELDL
jgi:hypothetical protein